MSYKHLIGAVAVVALAGGIANSQDWSAPPAYGSASLEAGFMDDPHSVAIQAGGAIDASNVSNACYGFVTHQPTYDLDYSAGAYDLFISAASDMDAIIMVNAPDGSWHCNDDAPSQGLNPGLQFSSPQSGLYNIWVGALAPGAGYEPAMLHISEIGYSSENQFSRAPNRNLPPHAGTISVSSGFNNDPRTIEVLAGGELSGSRHTSDNCWGQISEAPDAWVDYDAGNAFDLYLSMESDADTTLIVQAPNGDWHCDDDSAEDLNPGVRVRSPEAGRYAVWAGRFSGGELAPSTLFVSELGFRGNVDEPAVLDYSLPSEYGSTNLSAGFAPDPHNVAVMAGGGVDVFEAVGENCRGFTGTAPDFDVTYEAGSFDLYISATTSGDGTLAVNAPDGTWWCDDDSAGDLNPGIRFDAPMSGRYDVWVGTYDESGQESAVLHISELGFGDQFSSQGALDVSLPANFGDVALEGGFSPDPYVVDLIAGGPLAARDAADARCRGFVTAAPDYELSFTPGGLDLFISAISERDTTLVINAPDGSWVCNDDNNSLNPGVQFQSPEAGVYDIWVGTYSEGDGAEAQLFISELGFQD
jgi:hypothetical protein